MIKPKHHHYKDAAKYFENAAKHYHSAHKEHQAGNEEKVKVHVQAAAESIVKAQQHAVDATIQH